MEPIVYWLELIILALDISSLVGSTSSLPVIITFTLGFLKTLTVLYPADAIKPIS